MHHVFVDFENVPGIDLGSLNGKPVRVTLLIGKNQKKMPLSLVRDIHRLADRVELIEVGGTGRNALDLTLACYLGRAVQSDPKAAYAIISRDRDFDPMVAHLKANGISVGRHEDISALPFLKPPKPKAAQRRPAGKPAKASDRITRLAQQLREKAISRPRTKTRMLGRINADFGGKLSGADQLAKLDELVRTGAISIDGSGRIIYPPG